ncbi:MAG: hypothetical protein MZW92_11545 [Comamonadaceae bacterium]|nr:hypothetical protein [Comamonadaceae bacterium]
MASAASRSACVGATARSCPVRSRPTTSQIGDRRRWRRESCEITTTDLATGQTTSVFQVNQVSTMRDESPDGR